MWDGFKLGWVKKWRKSKKTKKQQQQPVGLNAWLFNHNL